MTRETLNTELYKILSGNGALKAAISGGIYIEERPDGSADEDIVINTADVQFGHPQSATSNVFVHIPDKRVKIKGHEQTTQDTERMDTVASLVREAIGSAHIEGIEIWVVAERTRTIAAAYAPEHYKVMSLEWNIQNHTD